MQNRRNYYRVLHVQPDAPIEIIHTSYLTLMRRLRMHPDLGGDHWNAAVINEAYSTLKDPELRAAYDRKLKRRTTTATRRDAPLMLKAARVAGQPQPPRSCLFCSAPYSVETARAADARCDICGSPLRPAERALRSSTARRAFQRIVRKMSMTFTPEWSRQRVVTGKTEDVSITGMQFTTSLELLPDERLKIDCAFCSAVGIVRHVDGKATALRPRWRVGVEFLTLLVKETRGGIVSVRA